MSADLFTIATDCRPTDLEGRQVARQPVSSSSAHQAANSLTRSRCRPFVEAAGPAVQLRAPDRRQDNWRLPSGSREAASCQCGRQGRTGFAPAHLIVGLEDVVCSAENRHQSFLMRPLASGALPRLNRPEQEHVTNTVLACCSLMEESRCRRGQQWRRQWEEASGHSALRSNGRQELKRDPTRPNGLRKLRRGDN